MKRYCRAALAPFLTISMVAGAESDLTEGSSAPASARQISGQSSISVYKYTNRQGVTSFSDRAPANRGYRIIKVTPGCFACSMDSSVDWHNIPLHLSSFQGIIGEAASRYNLDQALIRAVIHAESAFKPDAKSRAGALGLMQLMPETARDMGVIDPLSPDQNIHGGARYLSWLLQKTRGNITLATAAYNAGPGAVERYRGIPPYEETQTYVKRVRILHDRYRRALAPSF